MSRLLDSSNKLRESLKARNLYTPENVYDANISNTVETINNIVNIVSPFSSYDLSNTVIGRLVGNDTPLARIGLQMLARQFGSSAASNASAEYLPAIKFENLFDGDPDTKFLSVQKDFQITRRELQSNIGKILEEISGNYPMKGNPFGQNSTNIEYIKNSGKGQLQLLTKSLNANKYKSASSDLISALEDEGLQYSTLTSTVQFFNINSKFKPYNQYKTYLDEEYLSSFNINLNSEINLFRNNNNLEYGASQEYIDDLGRVSIKKQNNFTNQESFNYGLGDNDKVTDNLVWGRDGVDAIYLGADESERYIYGNEPSESGDFVPVNGGRFDFSNKIDKFGLKAGGLLSYTKELLNSKGKYASFDMTRKKFIDTDENTHFNGSPLTQHINGITDKNRQHTVLDPYNRFVKAIRYNGNKIYDGNQNSVIYNTVIPQVVPTVGGNSNKNLMFSIENLAIQVNADKTNPLIAYVDDEFGTELPICEKGPNDGRLMWFPPYDININENVVVNRTTTNFIGRGEPIYTYNNTERIVSLSFKLIIDYPPQVRGLNHKDASRFFAFGGEGISPIGNLGDKIKQREDLIKQRDGIKPTKKLQQPEITETSVDFYFANDQPRPNGQWDVEKHIEQGYETGNFTIDSLDFQLNVGFVDKIDNIINNYLNDELIEFVQIDILGFASALYNADNGAAYNKLLSDRRVEALKKYIKDRYYELNNKRLKDSLFSGEGLGQTGNTATDDTSEIPTRAAKEARSARATVRSNGKVNEVVIPISEKEQKDLVLINNQIIVLDTEIADIERENTRLNGCEFNPYVIEDGILKGFDSTEHKKYKPAFHSQTPEDFHRRLTFLHQCTRQGQAVRKNRGDDNNTFSANNAVFGRQPVQILRIGDMFHTKVFIDNMQIDYSDAPWDMNPEGMGMQFMIADIKLQLKLVGGQSLATPINALQNAISYNYYANSTFYDDGVYKTATEMENLQIKENIDVKKEKSVKTDDEETAQNNKTNTMPNSN